MQIVKLADSHQEFIDECNAFIAANKRKLKILEAYSKVLKTQMIYYFVIMILTAIWLACDVVSLIWFPDFPKPLWFNLIPIISITLTLSGVIIFGLKNRKYKKIIKTFERPSNWPPFEENLETETHVDDADSRRIH